MSKDAPSANFLAKIHGPAVEVFGWLWTGLAAAIMINLHPWRFFYGILACLTVYLASRDFPKFFVWIKFAKVAWVGFVSVAIAVLIAAYIGGWYAEIIIAGLATMCVGRLFDYLY